MRVAVNLWFLPRESSASVVPNSERGTTFEWYSVGMLRAVMSIADCCAEESCVHDYYSRSSFGARWASEENPMSLGFDDA